MATFTYNFTGTAGTKLATVSGWSKLGSGFDPEGPELNGSGQLRAPNPAGDVALIGMTQASTDHYAQAKVYAGFAFNGTGQRSVICVRADSRNEFWGVSYNSADGLWELFTPSGRVQTYSASLVDGDLARVEAEGTTIRVYINGTLRMTETGVSTYLTYAKVGVLVRDRPAADPIMDDWESGEISTTQTLTPSLVTNNQTFYGPTVTGGTAPQILAPGLVTNAQTFYAPTVALRGVTAAYVLANTAPVGGNPAGAMYEVAGLVGSGDYLTYTTVSGPTPGGGTLVQYIDGSFDYTGGAPAVWVIQIKVNGVDYPETTTIYLYDQEFTLLPPLLTNAQTFYGPTVSQAGGVQTLSPPRLTNTQTFYAATVGRGAVTLAPPRLNNAQTFYSATITGGVPSAANGMLTPQMRRRRR